MDEDLKFEKQQAKAERNFEKQEAKYWSKAEKGFPYSEFVKRRKKLARKYREDISLPLEERISRSIKFGEELEKLEKQFIEPL